MTDHREFHATNSWRAMVLGALLIVAHSIKVATAEATDQITEPQLVVHAGLLLGEPGEPPLKDQTLVVTAGRVSAIEYGFSLIDGVELLDLSDMVVLPGLIDMHTHLTMEVNREYYTNRAKDAPAVHALRAVKFARRTLLAGFTSVRDVGGHDGVDFALKTAIDNEDILGPRMFVSGKDLSITGGHGDPHIAIREDYVAPGRIENGIVDGVDNAIAATRLMIRRGADLIKLSVTGGVLSMTTDSSSPQFLPDELNAIVSTARDFQRKVAAHAHGDEGARRAIEAGVASIEHGTYLSPETHRLMRKNNVYLVPTIAAGKTIEKIAATTDEYPPHIARKALEVGPLMQEAFSRAYKAGVPIAFGTDAGVFPHGENAQEFIFMTEAGMPAEEAIRSATVSAAKLMGSRDIGVLRVGAYADLIAVPRDPREDIAQLLNVPIVVKGGIVVKDVRTAKTPR